MDIDELTDERKVVSFRSKSETGTEWSSTDDVESALLKLRLRFELLLIII